MTHDIKKKMIKYNLDKIYEIIEGYLKAYLREMEMDESHLLFYRYFKDLMAAAHDSNDKLSTFLKQEDYKNLPMDIKDLNEIRNRSILLLKEISNSF